MKTVNQFLAVLMCTFCVSSNSAVAQTTVLKNATVITGTGSEPMRNAVVALGEGKIEFVGKAEEYSEPTGAVVLDLSGKFILPGLIDAHVHLTSSEDTTAGRASLDRYFKDGVTTVRDMTGNGVALKQLQKEAVPAATPRPRVYFSALVGGMGLFTYDERVKSTAGRATPGKVAWMPVLDMNTNIRTLVSEAKQFGVTGLKFYGDISGELIERATEEAHVQGLQTWSHTAVFPATPLDIISSGVDSISHTDMLALAEKKTLPSYADARKMFLAGKSLGHASPYSPANLDLYQLMLVNDVVLEPTLSPFKSRDIESAAKYAKAAYEYGVKIGVGTDNDGTVLEEMKLLMQYTGMTEQEVIAAATANNAYILGMEDSIGSIDEGKVADLIILPANPLTDIDNLSKVELVIKGGVLHYLSQN